MAITRGSVVGLEMKMYYDSASSAGSPTWVEMPRVKDVSVSDTKTQVDVSRRESDNMLFAGGQKDVSLEFGYQYRKGATGTDTIFDALAASYASNTPMHILVVDGVVPPPSGDTTRGVEMWVEVFDFGSDQPLNDGVVYNVTAKPTDVYDNGTLLAPTPYEVTTP